MISKNIFTNMLMLFVLFSCLHLFSGCGAILPQGEMKVDPETLEPKNRRNGVTLDEFDELGASKSNRDNLRLADSLRKANKTENEDSSPLNLKELSSLTDPFIAKKTMGDDELIDEKGWMVGHCINMSSYTITLKIYRLRNGGLKPVYTKGIVPMWEMSYSLPKGSYMATVEMNGKTLPPHYFEVTPMVRADFDVNIYNKKSKEETTAALNGYWFILHQESGKERLVVSK